MAGVDLGGGSKKGHKGKGKKPKKRISVRIDMTPMVDVIMLLLTFFMLTTVFSTPQTMEINIPPEDTKVEVAESTLLTLRVVKDGTIYFNKGFEMPKPLASDTLHTFLVRSLQQSPKLICLLKVEREGTYDQMVNIMDEINLAQITRFSLSPFTDADARVIQKVKGA
jgi:biopolymer transport protein ExbD